MKTPILLITLLIFSSLSFGQSVIKRLDGTIITEEELTQKVDTLMAKAKVTGLEIAVFNQRNPVYQRAFGTSNNKTGKPLQITTNMYGASLSKAIFAVLVMKLVEENVISLDKPLQEYLPKPIYEYPHKVWHEDFTPLKDDPRYKKITARMCLSHTAGFPNWRWFEPDEKLRIKYEPGTRYSYSGEGLTYLQVVLEKITGRSLEDLAQEKIFKPLQMFSSSYRWQTAFEADFANGHDKDGKIYPKDKDNAPRGAGTLETTFEDYNRFITAVLNKKILKNSSYKEIFSPQVRIRSKNQFGPGATVDGDYNDTIQLSYGLGWGLLKSPYGWAAFKEGGGDGFHHYGIIFPDKGIGMVIMSNSEHAEGIFKYLLEYGIGDTFTPWKWDQYIPYDQK
ncbi:CubicO group peptidase, beta-lactamase class C family [Chryseobacterium soldanellicola]|uniref:CubicO group peptidase, beta-lactamase class C family n=1 Tax=Chryseobacterium soldanellicola TaxID=311333 RepID=A0A1H0XN91_9FLAO|nr:serine hydrolase domain-containing protein [Chryseobacterium soldanellicola]SDQ04106.1 CubicO group peptidase, beta-lactamase class C family [Chryseobacterium soldanellicola]